MLHTHRKAWRSRLVAPVAVACALLAGLDHSARADLFVSDLGGNQVLKFDDAGNPINPVPFIGSGGGGEGLACLMIGGVGELFVANNGATINIYNPTTGAFIRPFASGTGYAISALSLSPDGSFLYAAEYGGQRIDMFAATGPLAGTLLVSVPTFADHDVRVGPDGSGGYAVYAAGFENKSDVVKFSADLSTSTQFIANGNNGLDRPAGMTFDKGGNLWISNFGATPFVAEYNSSGGLMRSVAVPSATFGLDVGPDGNIYAAGFFSNTIMEIDDSTGVLNPVPFISNAGFEPKYVSFTENCVTAAVPEPSTMIPAALMGMLGIAGAAWRKAKRN